MRIAGIAVQMTSRRVLPWIGGPSMCSSPGPHPEVQDREADHRRHEHEDRDRGDDQDVPERVDLVGLRRGGGREPVDQQPERDAEHRRDHADDDHLPPIAGAGARRDGVAAPPRALLRAMGAGSYGSGGTDAQAGSARGRTSGSAGPRGGRCDGGSGRGAGGFARGAAAAARSARLRYADGETPWWRRNALANCAGWR